MRCKDLYSNPRILPREHEKFCGWPLCEVQPCTCVLGRSYLINQTDFFPLLCSVNCAVPQKLETWGLGDLEDSYRILWEGVLPTTPAHRGDNIQLLPMGFIWFPLVSVVSEALHLLFSFFWSLLKKL